MRANKKIDLWMCPTLLCVLLLVSVSLPARNSSILANVSSKDSIVRYWSLDPLVCDYVVKAVIVPHESSESGIKKMVVKRFRLYDNTGEPLILIDGEEAGMEYFNTVNEAGKIKSYFPICALFCRKHSDTIHFIRRWASKRLKGQKSAECVHPAL